MITIRTATVSDAKQLAVLAERTFRDTSAEHTTPEDMDMYCRGAYGESQQAQELSDPASTIVVAQWQDQLVAYAHLRWGQSPECVHGTHPGEIHRLYVTKRWHGKGLAHDLMIANLTLFERRSTDNIWLAVWENNPRAISFYEKFAFRKAGNQVFSLGNDRQSDLIMVRSASADGAV